jgi:chaperonin GroES
MRKEDTSYQSLLYNVWPLSDRVLVKRSDIKEEFKGGIVLPEKSREKPHTGEVLRVGNGRVTDEGARVPMDVITGDVVYFNKYAGVQIDIEGEEFVILREDELLLKIR